MTEKATMRASRRAARRRRLGLTTVTALTVGLGGTACREATTSRETISTETVWQAFVAETGLSSPMVSDLNGDGVGDVLVGHGVEYERGGLTALDGTNGALLWTIDAKDEVYATTPLVDLTGDGVVDPVMGGRKLINDLIAVDGRDGSRVWSLKEANRESTFPKTNINTPVRLPDQDGDGVDELLVVQAGGQDTTRPPAQVHLVSGKNGTLLWTKNLPDKLESYSVPSIVTRDGEVESLVVTSGGETLPGHVFRLDFPSLEERWRYFSEKKGVIGSPIVHRFPGTDREDVVVSSFNGKTCRLHGETGELIWEEGEEGYETYVSPALARLNDNPGADVVTLVSYGTWPVYTTESLMKWIDGKTGAIIHQEKVGIFSSSSPLVAELTGDDYDEIIIISNPVKDRQYGRSWSNLLIFDGRTRERLVEHAYKGFAAATPFLTDLGDDGRLDLIHSYWGVVQRTELSVPAKPTLIWNQFRGPHRDGVLLGPR